MGKWQPSQLFGISNSVHSGKGAESDWNSWPHPWNVSLGFNGWFDSSPGFCGCSEEMVQADKAHGGCPLRTAHNLRPAGQACARPTQTKVPQFSLAQVFQSGSFHIPALFRALNKVTVQRSMEMAKIIQAELLIILPSTNEYLLRRGCAKALGLMPGNGGE